MLTVSHSNASERGGSGWKEAYMDNEDNADNPVVVGGGGGGNANNTGGNSLESEDSIDSDNSSTSSRTGSRQSGGGANGAQLPIGCITTHGISPASVHEKKMPVDPLQFVKIQQNELCKKAMEQIKLAEEVKITKEKIKETEEEWQNNLMSWKSKRKLTKNNSDDTSMQPATNRKTKTFTEILEGKARAGARIGYNLQKYIGVDDEDENVMMMSQQQQRHDDYVRMGSTGEQESSDSLESSDTHTHDLEHDNQRSQGVGVTPGEETNLNRLLKSNDVGSNNNEQDDGGGNQFNRHGLGELVVFDTTLLEEFAVKQQQEDKQSICDSYHNNNKDNEVTTTTATSQQPQQLSPKVNVSIQDWKSSNHHHAKQQQQHHETSPLETDASKNNNNTAGTQQQQQQQQQNSSFEVEEEEDELLDEEMERLRLDQERSFKAKLYAFESLAKQDEEQARKANEASRRRQKQRADFSLKQQQLRSKSCSNMVPAAENENKKKVPVSATVSASHLIGGSLQNSLDEAGAAKQQQQAVNRNPIVGAAATNRSTQQPKSQSRSMQNLSMQPSSQTFAAIGVPSSSVMSSSTVYNFQQQQQQPPSNKGGGGQVGASKSVCQLPELLAMPDAETMSQQSSQSEPAQQLPMKARQQFQPMDHRTIDHLNIYENVPPHAAAEVRSAANLDGQLVPHDPLAMRNASHKLLAQQQQIYQNQPHPGNEKVAIGLNNAIRGGNGFNVHQQPQQHHHQGDIGLPAIATGNNMVVMPMKQDEEHLYVNHNQLMINPANREAAPTAVAAPIGSYEYCGNNYDGIVYPGQQQPPQQQYFAAHEPNYENKMMLMQQRQQQQHQQQQLPPSTAPAAGLYHGTGAVAAPPHCPPYLLYPKPYMAPKMLPAQQQLAPPVTAVGGGAPRSIAYNQNHWLLQEAELRRQLESIEVTQRLQQQQQSAPGAQIPSVNNGSNSSINNKTVNSSSTNNNAGGGYLSVSGKKKCSSCGEELGKGCAAMVVESLSLYYHINCFRCSVCNVQLGNGTVGTDVRVRNNKLHCQNCYSNDEAGLKFSRV